MSAEKKESNTSRKTIKNIWRTSNLNYILNGIQHSKQNSEATWKPNGKYHSATTVERRTQCTRLLRAQHHQNASKTMMRCYVREVRQKLRKTCARHAGCVFAATSIPSSHLRLTKGGGCLVHTASHDDTAYI